MPVIAHHRVHADDHPAAIFGAMVGTLAVLMAVLVFAIYSRVDDARRAAHNLPVHSMHQQR
jgi:hypothetical protein